MEDFESVALGLAPGRQKKVAVREHLNYNNAELVQLARTHNGDQLYQVLLRLRPNVLGTCGDPFVARWLPPSSQDQAASLTLTALPRDDPSA